MIASEFLGEHLILRPGSTQGVKVPVQRFAELRHAADEAQGPPVWLVEAARARWGLDLPEHPVAETVRMRKPSRYGFGLASWEINLGCNYDCEHCYLGLKRFEGLPWAEKERLLHVMDAAGVLWFQITGGEPLVDRHFADAYTLAHELGMMLTISTNGSRLWRPELLHLLDERRPYRIVVSVYGASESSYDGLTRRPGSFRKFTKGMDAAVEAGLPMRLNLVITRHNADEESAMVAMAERWGVEYNTFTNMSPTIYGGAESLPSQSAAHLRERKVFTGCNAGHSFFHVDPHGRASICKVGRDPSVDLMHEGVGGLTQLGGIADSLMLRTGGCSGCALSGSCRVCRPLARLYQEAKAPLHTYCQHGERR
nr:radical SAM protein [Streptomyces boncukensis]